MDYHDNPFIQNNYTAPEQPVPKMASNKPPAEEIKLKSALLWGLETTFTRAILWIPVGILISISYIYDLLPISVAVEMPAIIRSNEFPLMIIWLVVIILVLPSFMRMGIHQAYNPQAPLRALFKDPTKRSTAMGSLMLFMAAIVGLVLVFISMVLGTLVQLLRYTLEGLPMGANSPFYSGILITTVLFTVVVPFFYWIIWFQVSGLFSTAQSCSFGFKLGANNYFKTLGLLVMFEIFSMITANFTAGITSIITIPILLLASAHVFVQANRSKFGSLRS